MQVLVETSAPQTCDADAVVVSAFQGVTAPDGATAAMDQGLGGQISRVLASRDFKGEVGDTLVLYGGEGVRAPRVILVGLGKPEALGLDQIRRAAASAANAARQRGAERLASIVHGAGEGGLDAAAAAQATVEGTLLGLYQFRAYKSRADDDEAAGVRLLTLLEPDAARLAAVRAGADVGQAVAAGVTLARDLANHPSNTATPTYLAEQAGELAARFDMRWQAWDRERIVAEGMGALASVGKGSHEPPRFISLEYAPAGTADQPPYVLVGKGLTFDAGGISLKPGLKMGVMKADMAGAAAVLGAMEAVGRLALPLHVCCLVAATENLPGGSATKPGDIVRARNGTTIEILNTDAEGRMVLADALSYAQDLKPRAVVDLATLTGAIVIALGDQAAGLFANDDALAEQLTTAGERSDEKLWRLPLWDGYGKMIESDVADIKNVADSQPSPAGSIFGAKFLERFVAYPWAHVDIAGVFWDAKDIAYLPKGATGFGVRLLTEWLRAQV
jgi:leucyl aminopeptidase